jgi:hypothetical protein
MVLQQMVRIKFSSARYASPPFHAINAINRWCNPAARMKFLKLAEELLRPAIPV